MFAKLRIKLYHFWKKHKYKIAIIILVWLIIFFINWYLKNHKAPEVPQTTYEPHVSIMKEEEVPKKLQEPIDSLMDEFVQYANKGEYEKAYDLLTADCKENKYPTLEKFKEYIDYVFEHKPKIYYIQSFSTVKKNYIYRIRIMDDIMATGLTGVEELRYYEEKYTVKEENGTLKLSVGGYVGEEEIDAKLEDDYLKVAVVDKQSNYDTVNYKVEITNKTEYIVVLADGGETQEILLNLGDQFRKAQNIYQPVTLQPYETKTFTFNFIKYYDEQSKDESIVFNTIRVLRSYSGQQSDRLEELSNAVKLYSTEIMLQQ